VSAAVTAATPMKSATPTMEGTSAEAMTIPAMLMVFTPKTAEIPATEAIAVVWITVAIVKGIIEAIAVGIRIVIVVMVMFSLSAWRSNKHHYTY